MSIAILFYGLTRSLKYTAHSIENNILKVLRDSGISFKIYLHTYDLKVLTNPRSHEKNIVLDTNEYTLLHPDFVTITSQEEFIRNIRLHNFLRHGDAWKERHHSSLKNLLCQLNSLNLVFTMTANESYDCYLCLRPDLEYIHQLDINQIREIIKRKDENILYTPAWDSSGGCNDRFCFGSKLAISKIATRIQELQSYSQRWQAHSERFLQFIIEKNKIQSRKTTLRAIRVRANGVRNKKDYTSQ